MSQFASGYALAVGVGKYVHSQYADLAETVRDAQAIESILVDPNKCGYLPEHIQILTNEQATGKNIRSELERLAQSANPDSTVFIFFSGHGGRSYKDGSWYTYLCPREADPTNLSKTAISGDDFSGLIASIRAQKVLVVIDACHAGGAAEFKSAEGLPIWEAGLPDTFYEKLSSGSGRVIIASSKPEQSSFVRTQGDLSLFTWHLLKALDGKAAIRMDGLIHVLDVFHYVNEEVSKEKPEQVPTIKVRDLDLNFPIALHFGGKGTTVSTVIGNEIITIRERIINNPINGSKALSEFLAKQPKWTAKRNEVDLRRAELEHIQYEIELFGPNDNDKASKNRVIFSLLRICLEVEQSEH